MTIAKLYCITMGATVPGRLIEQHLRRPDGGLGSDRFGVRKSCLGALRFVVAHRTGRGDSYIARHVGFDAPCHIWMRHVGQFGAPIAEPRSAGVMGVP